MSAAPIKRLARLGIVDVAPGALLAWPDREVPRVRADDIALRRSITRRKG